MSFNKIISIHGVPRSGTSWLGQIFDSSPEVRYKFQPLFSFAFKNEITLNSDQKELMKYYTRLYNYKDSFLDQEDKKIKGVYPDFEKKEVLPAAVVTKMVRYHYLIPHLLKKLNNIYIVAIVRNPCAVLNSWQNAPKEFLDQWKFQDEWRFAQSMNQFKPEQYYGFNKWKEATKLFLEMEKEYPDNFHLLRYEDLVKMPLEISKELYEFTDIEWNDQTEEFLDKSTSISQKDKYSVYKGKKDPRDWEGKLDSEIVDKIYSELKDTEFEEFLR